MTKPMPIIGRSIKTALGPADVWHERGKWIAAWREPRRPFRVWTVTLDEYSDESMTQSQAERAAKRIAKRIAANGGRVL